MIMLVTYSDESMNISKEKCVMSALLNGVDHAYGGSPRNIDTGFKTFNKEIFKSERGCGYWLWKPYLIEYVMRDLKEDDYLIYSDAGVEFINDVNHIIEKMDEDIFFFSNGHKHVEWCKADVICNIENSIWDKWDTYKQVQASVIFFRVNQKTRDFVKEWLLWCQMPGFIDDSPSTIPNYPTFSEHRHDQAILTCLQIKYGYKLHWWPAKYEGGFLFENNGFKDSYPPMFLHHRKRNSEYQNLQTA